MKRIFIGLFVHILMSPLAFADWVDEANHEAIFIEMEDTTKLEVLDWGGDNRQTLFLLAGMPMNAHTYAGHSFAGFELTYLGKHFPERVNGLIYIDAVQAYEYVPEINEHCPDVAQASIDIFKYKESFYNT